MHTTPQTAILVTTSQQQIQCCGDWTHHSLTPLTQQWQQIRLPAQTEVTLDGAQLTAFDTSGAWLLVKLVTYLTEQGKQVHFEHFTPQHWDMYELVNKQAANLPEQFPQPKSPSWLYRLGKATVKKAKEFTHFLAYWGEIFINFGAFALNPMRFQWRNMLYNVEQVGFRALPIVALLSFLIGIVLAYQMGLQLKDYGANIFIVDLTGIAVLREFGPLITAIIAAGRTSSAFTAQLGLMKTNDEISALRTMGISPIHRLVLPKIVATLIAIPLLIMWADIFGVLGSMVMADNMLAIQYTDFLHRLQTAVNPRTFWIGMSKAPVFALIIACVGCFQGFQVESNADSVGRYTTKSVVQAIFLIIIADAIYSIIFSWRNM